MKVIYDRETDTLSIILRPGKVALVEPVRRVEFRADITRGDGCGPAGPVWAITPNTSCAMLLNSAQTTRSR